MIFFLSASVDLISLIGYASATKFLSREEKRIKLQKFGELKIGKEAVYRSLFSTIIAYRYKYRDLSSAFRISQIMHIFSSFLLFGHMAVYMQGYVGEGLWKSLVLWMFLLSAYVHAF